MALKAEKEAAKIAKKVAKLEAKEAKRMAKVDAAMHKWESRMSPPAEATPSPGGDDGGQLRFVFGRTSATAAEEGTAGFADVTPTATGTTGQVLTREGAAGLAEVAAAAPGMIEQMLARQLEEYVEAALEDWAADNPGVSPEGHPGWEAERAAAVAEFDETVRAEAEAAAGPLEPAPVPAEAAGGISRADRRASRRRAAAKAKAERRAAKAERKVAKATAKQMGVSHGTIKQGAGVGGFTQTKMALSKEVVRCVGKAADGSVVAMAIDEGAAQVVLDPTAASHHDGSAASVAAALLHDAPRFYLVASRKQSTFLYCCPPGSARAARMLYATSKASVLQQVRKATTRKLESIEVTEPSELIEAPPPARDDGARRPSAVARAEVFDPTAQKGSLSAFMVGQLGETNATLMRGAKKKIVRAPPGAYG